MDDLISRLLAKHESEMRAKGRNPLDYTSKWRLAANTLTDLAALSPEPAPVAPATEPVAWHTEDEKDDPSATTYSRDVMLRWIRKGWPVTPLYAHPTDAESLRAALEEERASGEGAMMMLTQVTVERDTARAENERLRTAQGAAKILMELWESALPTDLDSAELRGTRLRMRVHDAMMSERIFGLMFFAALRALAGEPRHG
jgi:hypothetical protein